MGASQQGQEPMNMRAEKFAALGAVTKQQVVKTQQTEKT
jgi:hypothetical protein